MIMCFDKRIDMMSWKDKEYNTPLHFACESGNCEIVKLLLLNNADPLACRMHDVTPLHIAAKEGFIDIASVLLQNDASEIDIADANLLSPIHYAAQFGKVKMIEFLLHKGADIECQDTDSYTPLLTSAAYGQLQAMKALINAKASTDDVDRNGKSLVFITAEEDQVQILEALVLGVYEKWGSELVNTPDAIHNTPLHIAAKKGHINSLKILLKASHLKVDARNEAERTPLHLAAVAGHANVINELLHYAEENDKDILKDEDDDGNTALHLACINEKFQAAKALILAGADPEDRNARQWTPMDCAAESGRVQIVQLLIDAEAQVDPRDINNATPLHVACKAGHIKVVNVLLENGAKVSICDSKGFNALDVAIENGQKDVAMAIVTSNQWMSALRNVTYFDQSTNSAVGGGAMGGATFTTPMRRIIRKMPDVAEVVFNRCCQTNEDAVSSIDHPDYKINFIYEFLEDFRVDSGYSRRFTRTRTARRRSVPIEEVASSAGDFDEDTEGGGGGGRAIGDDNEGNVGYQTTWGPVGYSRQDHCLQILANSKSVELLKHPLAANLLHYKWFKYGQMLYFSNLFIYLLFVIFLTSFALASLSPNSNTCQIVLSNANSSSLSCTAETSRASQYFVPVGAAFVILFAIIKLLFEFIQFLKYRIQYLLDWVNYLELLLFVFAILFAFIYTEDCYCPHKWQWELGAIAVFLSWIDLVIFVSKLPITGIYVVMFMNIFYIFLKLVFLAILLVLAFAFSFNMLFNDPISEAMGIRTPFMNSWRSIVKTMTMTTGEFEFDSTFRQTGSQSEAGSDDIQFPFASYVLWILFLILMPILFINLLVGLAVDDIKGMQESAGTNRLALRVELTLTVEEYLPLWLRKNFIVGRDTIYPNRKLGFIKHLLYNVLGVFRFDSAENIKNALNAPPAPIEEVQQQNQALARRVDDLCSSVETLSEQNERLLAVVSALAESQGVASNVSGIPPSSPAHSLKPAPGSTSRGRSPSALSEKTTTSFI
ncbi:PREDICTED: transient receptor potential cation channel subfamily A member 1 homolog [Amphimedon queenslandica]|uniref:Ion transport domain-containing protein n=1 Tax=Amphimedon queenslandica TaxID=400682 RepID=A0AAN0J3U5_AMPQE|nr:PREDICTED: transient receptor potential cation channel subfamily A member 1 homolog [Amphimedon queenslandica]|eukprot:XP_019851378.1 PREDICTED: transient receptor potential cation channel subfamily A member 1 homolog [Amphimedon queenslandica]